MSSFCLGCGKSLAEGERFCGNCGRDSSTAPSVPALDPAAAFGLPPETSGKALFSLICGILFLFLPFSIVAVIFGHLSLSEIRLSAGRLTGRGLAITGIVLGYVGVAVIATLIIVGVFSVRRNLRAQRKVVPITTSQNSAVSAVRTLNTAEIAYAQAHPAAGYTCSLSDLSDSWGISSDLARGKTNGYSFVLQGCAAKKVNGPISAYQVLAYPVAANNTGKPAYCSNESDVIKVQHNGSPQDCLTAGVDLSAGEVNR